MDIRLYADLLASAILMESVATQLELVGDMLPEDHSAENQIKQAIGDAESLMDYLNFLCIQNGPNKEV
jgi:hypothetical protein